MKFKERYISIVTDDIILYVYFKHVETISSANPVCLAIRTGFKSIVPREVGGAQC